MPRPDAGAPLATLVVEDDPVTAKLISRYVSEVDGFTVAGVAATGRAALALACRLPLRLVLLDLRLPDIPGLEVARQLRAPSMPEVDVIVISSAGELDDVRRAMRHGALQYLLKPVSFPALRDRLLTYRASLEQPAARPRSQADVDRLYEQVYAGTAALPKGIAAETLEAVLDVLRGAANPLSAKEVGEQLGIGRVTARRYLEHLAALAVATVTLRYGTAGRPEHRFALAETRRGP